jgi:VWFA-related protein
MNYIPLRTVAITVSLALSQATPQTPPPQFRASVDVMRIEVTVLDKRTRKPVRGLTAADFIVKVNGDQQPIEALDEVEVPGREASRSAPFPEAARDVTSNALTNPRLFVIVMDDVLVSREGFPRQKGKDIAHAVVNALGPSDMAAVVFAQDNRHAQDYTADRAALRRAIETYDPRPLHPFLARAMSLGVVERASAFLRRMPGHRRAIVWITLGPGVVDLEDESLVTWAIEPPRPSSITAGEGQAALARATDRVASGGRVAPVPIYAYSTEGLKPVTASEIRGGRMPSPFGNEAMDQVARATGGRLIHSTNAPESEVPSMFGELSSYYAIAFRTNFPMDGKLRRLHVEAKRSDVLIVPSDTPFATPKDLPSLRAAARTEKPSRLIEALSGPLPLGDIRLSLGHVAVAVADNQEQAVALTLGIPTPATGADPQQFAVSLFVFDGEGLREIQKQDLTVTATPRRDDGDLISEVAIPLSLRPGRYIVRVAVAQTQTEAKTGAAGSVYTTITVPDFAKERLSMSGVAVGRAEGRPIGGRDAVQAHLPFAPTVVREFSTTDRVGALVRVYQAAGRSEPVQLETQVLDATDAVVASGSSVLPASSFNDGRNVEHRYELPLRTLSPGEYLLRFAAEAAGRRVTREVRFSLR